MKETFVRGIQLPIWLGAALLISGAVRAGSILIAAMSHTRGDYYASMPGAYVRTLNPTLWNDPDLQWAMGFQNETYLHGPIQYLTLYPVAFFDSYEQIAQALLPIYVLVVAVTIVCLLKALRALAPNLAMAIPVVSAALFFFPLLQAVLQREFEVVSLLGLTVAFWFVLTDRQTAAGVTLAYVAWYKYIPLLFVGYLGLRRWTRMLAAFAGASVAILITTHTVLGLPLFFNNNVPDHAAGVLTLTYGFQFDEFGKLVGSGFCHAWYAAETANAGIRHGLCTLGARWRWLSPPMVYLALCFVIAGVYLIAHRRFERDRSGSPDRERWRRALEFSIAIAVCTCFFFTHYYYLAALLIPSSVLLVRYLWRERYGLLGAWLATYVLLTAFLVPSRILSPVFGTDAYRLYIEGAWFLLGELLLMTLLLREYVALSHTRDERVALNHREG